MAWYNNGERLNQKPTAAQTLACLQKDLLLEPAEDMQETQRVSKELSPDELEEAQIKI